MKVYIASVFDRRPEMLRIKEKLIKLGHTVTSRWLTEEGLSKCLADEEWIGVMDATDVMTADVLMLFTREKDPHGRGGHHVEYGLAVGMNKFIIIVGPYENAFHNLADHKHYPRIFHVDTYTEARKVLHRLTMRNKS